MLGMCWVCVCVLNFYIVISGLMVGLKVLLLCWVMFSVYCMIVLNSGGRVC